MVAGKTSHGITSAVESCKAAIGRQGSCVPPVPLVTATMKLLEALDFASFTPCDFKLVMDTVAGSAWLPALCKQVRVKGKTVNQPVPFLGLVYMPEACYGISSPHITGHCSQTTAF